MSRGFYPLAALPSAALGVLKELARHLLRRPVVGLCVVATCPDGRMVLVRRGDTGTWALPGGTVEWGETLSETLHRELREEAGVDLIENEGLVGVFSRPDRDPRFHAVTVVVRARVSDPVGAPHNSLEIREVALFDPARLPADLAMTMSDFVAAARRGAPPTFE